MLALTLSVILGQAIVQKPVGWESTDPVERLAAVRELVAQPASEVRGGWLFESLSDPDPQIVITSLKAWRTYETGFIDQLGEAITEGQLDGKPISEPAKTIPAWEDKLAKLLLQMTRTGEGEVPLESAKTLARLTQFDKGLGDGVLLKVLRLGDPVNLKNSFVVAIRTLAEEKPKLILELLKSGEPEEAMGAILSIGFQMPAEADEIYRGFVEKRHPNWLKALITGFSYRGKELRTKHIGPYLRNGNVDVRLAAANLIGLEDAEWKDISLNRGNPGYTRALAIQSMNSVSWTESELERLHFDPDPLVQAAIAPRSYQMVEVVDYDLLWKRFRSSVPELRAACLQVIMSRAEPLRARALELGFADRSALVRTAAAIRPTPGFERQMVQAFEDGLIKMLPYDLTMPENKAVLDACLRSRSEKSVVTAMMVVMLERPQDAIPRLTQLAKSNNEEVRFNALSSIAFMEEFGGYQALTTLAWPANPKLFAAAVGWISRGFKDHAIPFLRGFVTHPERKVRIAAKSKIAELLKADPGGSG